MNALDSFDAMHMMLSYIGPGAGLSAIGALLALILAMFVAVAGFVWYPIRRLLRRRSRAKPQESEKLQ